MTTEQQHELIEHFNGIMRLYCGKTLDESIAMYFNNVPEESRPAVMASVKEQMDGTIAKAFESAINAMQAAFASEKTKEVMKDELSKHLRNVPDAEGQSESATGSSDQTAEGDH